LSPPDPGYNLSKALNTDSGTPLNSPFELFYVDATVFRLGKWLRLLGLDCPTIPFSETSFPRGILLTRRKEFSQQNHHTAWVPYNTIKAQLAWFMEKFHPILPRETRRTRCMRCNQRLLPAPKESVKDIVPDYIYQVHQHFSRCPQCNRIYWNGTHLQRMAAFLEGAGIYRENP